MGAGSPGCGRAGTRSWRSSSRGPSSPGNAGDSATTGGVWSQQGTPGRPAIAKDVRDLIGTMWQANPTWGSPRLVGFNITEHPTTQWTAQQVVEAFFWDEAPCYLLRDRDAIYGAHFRHQVQNIGIEEAVIAPRSPWQNPYVERLIGSIRRECLNHVIVLHERHVQRILAGYFVYEHHWRTHLSLTMDCPEPRLVDSTARGRVIAVPEVGGLHHHYERMAA